MLENTLVKEQGLVEGAIPPKVREAEPGEADRAGGGIAAGNGKPPDPEVPAHAKRRQYTAEYKQRIVREADACKKPGEIGALLRREGLYSSCLVAWRRLRDQGGLPRLGPQARGPKPDLDKAMARENDKLRRENERLQKRLEQAELIIDVQKKVAKLLGVETVDPERGGSS